MRIVIVAVLTLFASPVYAEGLTVICKYERSVDSAGKSEPIIGGMSVSVTFILPMGTPKNLQIKTTKAPCYDFVGDGDDMKFTGSCVRFLENGNAPKMKMTTILKIDRVSGAFDQTVQFDDKGGLAHSGRCTAATRAF